MMEPPQLLKDLGVVWCVLEYPVVSILSGFELFLLLVDVADLEPDVIL